MVLDSVGCFQLVRTGEVVENVRAATENRLAGYRVLANGRVYELTSKHKDSVSADSRPEKELKMLVQPTKQQAETSKARQRIT